MLVVGIDGATLDLIKPWAQRGYLPCLGRLIREGVYGYLESTLNFHSASAWTSIITGANRGKHGVFSFSYRNPCTREFRLITSKDRRTGAFWDHVPDLRVGLVNIPMTYPVKEINGVMVAGIGAPTIDSPGACYPPTILKDVLQNHAASYKIAPPATMLLRRDKELAIQAWLKVMEMRGLLARHLLQREYFDLFMIVFTATDWVQHFFWHELFDERALTQSGTTPRQDSAVFIIYRAIDEELQKLIGSAADDVPILIVSDHGFGHQQGAVYALESWFVQEGFLSLRRDAVSNARRYSLEFAAGFMRSFQNSMPRVVKEPLRKLLYSILQAMISRSGSRRR
jgi:predicted AlkP superfamily phosphohydrolase/phosphomutase